MYYVVSAMLCYAIVLVYYGLAPCLDEASRPILFTPPHEMEQVFASLHDHHTSHIGF